MPIREILMNITNDGALNVNDTDYFRKKGYSDGIIKKFRLGYLKKGLLPYAGLISEEPEVLECYKYVIPDFDENGTIDNIQFRSDIETENKNLTFELNSTYCLGNCDKNIWNGKILYGMVKGTVIFITETWTDALSIEEAGYKALSLNRIVNVLTLWKTAKKISNIREGVYISICDNDHYGNKSNKNIKNMFTGLGCDVFVYDRFPDNIKDCNEWLQRDRTEFIKSINEYVNNLTKVEKI